MEVRRACLLTPRRKMRAENLLFFLFVFLFLFVLLATFPSAHAQTPCYISLCSSWIYPSGNPYEVSVGVLVVAIDSLDKESSVVRFDAYIWLRWPICTLDFDNDTFRPDLYMELDNGINRVDLTERPFVSEPVCDSVNGTVYQQFRVEGQFLQELDYRRYPLDSHTLSIKIEDALYPRSLMVYVPDSIKPSSAITSGVRLPGWVLGSFGVSEAAHVYNTKWGSENPAYSYNVYSNFRASVEINRGVTVYILRVLPPVVVTILIISIVFLLEIEETEARIAVIAGGLLAMIFLQLTFSSTLPSSIDYLTVVDWLFNSMYMLILGILIETIVIRWFYHWLARRDLRKKEKVEKEEEEAVQRKETLRKERLDRKEKEREEQERLEREREEQERQERIRNAKEHEKDDDEDESEEDEEGTKKVRDRSSSSVFLQISSKLLGHDADEIADEGLAQALATTMVEKIFRTNEFEYDDDDFDEDEVDYNLPPRKFSLHFKGIGMKKKQSRKVKMIHAFLERLEKWVFFVFILLVCLNISLVTVIARYA